MKNIKLKLYFIFFIIVNGIFVNSQNNTSVVDVTGEKNVNIISPIESNGALPVNILDQHTEIVNLYVYRLEASPELTRIVNTGDLYIKVNSITGIDVGDAITIYQADHVSQSIVKSRAGDSIGIAVPIDHTFALSSIVEVGAWNMNVNGSSTPVIFRIKPPSGVSFDIYTINVGISDNGEMDSGKFGSLTALTNGFVASIVDGDIKNLFLVVSNIGFAEQGFTVQYDSKAPAGTYGFTATKNFHVINGVAIRVDGALGDTFEVYIRDNLSALTNINLTINGHYTTL